MFPYDRFVKFEEMTGLLRKAVDAHPSLARMAAIGTSYEGRSIWAVTVTNYATGEPLTKPAFYVDANIHATELSGSVAAMDFGAMTAEPLRRYLSEVLMLSSKIKREISGLLVR